MSSSILHTPLQVGDLLLPNRIIMAPLTRCRSDPDRAPTQLNAHYYKQRASAGLIIAEATCILPKSVGYPRTPGIWSEKQIQGWTLVTQAVHEAGGRIFLQLWHCGRVSDPYYLDGDLPVAPSAIGIDPSQHVSLLRPKKSHVVPRALELQEIPEIVEAYAQAARNAKAAGFDGIEIHSANGYLLDEFLQDKANKRTDIYGGSIENRVRLLLEVTDAVIKVWGPDRVGIHLASRGDFMDMGDSDPKALFTHIATELAKRRVAFIFLREYLADDSLMGDIKKAFGGVVIANERLSKKVAENIIETEQADAVSFGCLYIANPDLVQRLAHDEPSFNEPDPTTFYPNYYSDEPQIVNGYTDYPFLSKEPER